MAQVGRRQGRVVGRNVETGQFRSPAGDATWLRDARIVVSGATSNRTLGPVIYFVDVASHPRIVNTTAAVTAIAM